MTFDYTRSRATAERLLVKFGQAATLRRKALTGPAYDPTVTTADHACTVVVQDYADAMIDGTRIKRGDKKVLVSTKGLTIDPTAADALVIGGTSHEVVMVKPLAPGGTVVMWEVQARA